MSMPPLMCPCTPENILPHSHRCEGCNHIWNHVCSPGMTDEERIQAHTCPVCEFCGPRPWPIFRGEGAVSLEPAMTA